MKEVKIPIQTAKVHRLITHLTFEGCFCCKCKATVILLQKGGGIFSIISANSHCFLHVDDFSKLLSELFEPILSLICNKHAQCLFIGTIKYKCVAGKRAGGLSAELTVGQDRAKREEVLGFHFLISKKPYQMKARHKVLNNQKSHLSSVLCVYYFNIKYISMSGSLNLRWFLLRFLWHISHI